MEILNYAMSLEDNNSCDTYCSDNWNPGCCENN